MAAGIAERGKGAGRYQRSTVVLVPAPAVGLLMAGRSYHVWYYHRSSQLLSLPPRPPLSPLHCTLHSLLYSALYSPLLSTLHHSLLSTTLYSPLLSSTLHYSPSISLYLPLSPFFCVSLFVFFVCWCVLCSVYEVIFSTIPGFDEIRISSNQLVFPLSFTSLYCSCLLLFASVS